ncbi:MAG: hypothetical protein AAF530_24525 [Pseudomonadota bacterium]
MRAVIILTAVFLVLAAVAFLGWGGFALMVLGAILILICLTGLGNWAAWEPRPTAFPQTELDQATWRKDVFGKKKTWAIGLLIAIVLLLIGYFLSDVPGPLSDFAPL